MDGVFLLGWLKGPIEIGPSQHDMQLQQTLLSMDFFMFTYIFVHFLVFLIFWLLLLPTVVIPHVLVILIYNLFWVN